MEQELKLSFDLNTLDSDKDSTQLKPQDGDTFVRILPPFGTNHNNSLFHFYGVHWGFKTAEGKTVPVSCSYDTEKFCPVCEKVWAAEDQLKASGLSDEEKQELQNYVKKNRADRAFYYNVLTTDGKVMKLKIGKKAHEALLGRLKESVNVKKIDPVSIESGVWFTINRTGKLFDTVYTVEFKKTTVEKDGEIFEKLDTTKIEKQFPELYQALKNQLATSGKGLLFDIHTLFQPLTSLELKEILSTGVAPKRARRSEQTLQIESLQPVQNQAAASDKAAVPASAAVANAVASAASGDVNAEIARLNQLQGN